MKRAMVIVGTSVALLVGAHPSWAARDICKMLKDKGLLNDQEYNECKAAQEKEDAGTEAKTREVMGTKLPKWLDMITPFGDLRIRHEGFYENDVVARNRARLRARIGLNVNVSDELAATVRLATGDPNDPISTNQSFQNTFTRKPVSFDQAYLTLKPGKTVGLPPGWVTITAGKFGANAYRVSELVWDDDLSPEGASETLNLVERKEGFLRGLRINAFEWVVDEIATSEDPWMGGAQAVADTAFGSTANWTFAFANYHYEKLNGIAAKFLSKNTTDPKDPTKSNANSSANGSLANSNTVRLDQNNNILGYVPRFNIINANTELNFSNPFGVGVPAGVFGDWAYNTQADTRNNGFYVGAGIGKAGKDWYHNGMKNQGDWCASYTYAWVEKDAVLSMFSYSDLDYLRLQNANATQKGSSNVIAHILRLDYVLFPNLQLTAKAHFINALDRKNATSSSGLSLSRAGNSTLVRTQLDAVLKF